MDIKQNAEEVNTKIQSVLNENSGMCDTIVLHDIGKDAMKQNECQGVKDSAFQHDNAVVKQNVDQPVIDTAQNAEEGNFDTIQQRILNSNVLLNSTVPLNSTAKTIDVVLEEQNVNESRYDSKVHHANGKEDMKQNEAQGATDSEVQHVIVVVKQNVDPKKSHSNVTDITQNAEVVNTQNHSENYGMCDTNVLHDIAKDAMKQNEGQGVHDYACQHVKAVVKQNVDHFSVIDTAQNVEAENVDNVQQRLMKFTVSSTQNVNAVNVIHSYTNILTGKIPAEQNVLVPIVPIAASVHNSTNVSIKPGQKQYAEDAYDNVDDVSQQNTTLSDKDIEQNPMQQQNRYTSQQISTEEEEEANTACLSSKMASLSSNRNDTALAIFSKADEKEAGGVIQEVQSYTPISITNIYNEGSINDNGEFLSLNGKNKQEIRYNMRDMVIKSKLWDQCYSDEDESLDEGSTGWLSDREGQQDGCNSTGGYSVATIKPKIQTMSANTTGNGKQSYTASNLNHNAPIFIPKNDTTLGTSKVTTIEIDQRKITQKAIQCSGESSVAGLKTESPNFGKNQKLVLHNRQPQMNCILTDNNTLLISSNKFQNDMEGEEEILTQCRKNAARMGDLSPTHCKTSKRSHQWDRSWDGRMAEDANKRKLPMRIAKQKQITQNTLRKASKTKNKA